MYWGLAWLHVSHGARAHHPSLTRHHLSDLLTCHHLRHLTSDHHLTSLHLLHLLGCDLLPRWHLAPLHLSSLHLHLLLGGRPHLHPEARSRRPHEPVLHLHGLGLTRGPHAWLGAALSVHRRHVASHMRCW